MIGIGKYRIREFVTKNGFTYWCVEVKNIFGYWIECKNGGNGSTFYDYNNAICLYNKYIGRA